MKNRLLPALFAAMALTAQADTYSKFMAEQKFKCEHGPEFECGIYNMYVKDAALPDNKRDREADFDNSLVLVDKKTGLTIQGMILKDKDGKGASLTLNFDEGHDRYQIFDISNAIGYTKQSGYKVLHSSKDYVYIYINIVNDAMTESQYNYMVFDRRYKQAMVVDKKNYNKVMEKDPYAPKVSFSQDIIQVRGILPSDGQYKAYPYNFKLKRDKKGDFQCFWEKGGDVHTEGESICGQAISGYEVKHIKLNN